MSPRKTIRLLDMRTGSPIGIYLEPDNTVALNTIQLVYPNATSIKCVVNGARDPRLFPCQDGKIECPEGTWPDEIYEPMLPSCAAQPSVNLITVHCRGYAPCQLQNSSRPQLVLDAKLLIDCGSSIDLILPMREAEKLQLKPETDTVLARCFNNRISTLRQYEDILIRINLKHTVTEKTTTKRALIFVYVRVPPAMMDAETQYSDETLPEEAQPINPHLFTPPGNRENIATTPLVSNDAESNVSILKLSPLKSSSQQNDRYGILGYPALAKMDIGVHFGGNYIFTLERVLEHSGFE